MRRARRLSALVASVLLFLICQLLWAHQKLASIDKLDDDGVTGGVGSARTGRWSQWGAFRRQQRGASLRQLTQRALPNPAVIVFCYNRVNYLNQTLHSLASLKGLQDYSVYVSQDGNDTGVQQLVEQLSVSLFGEGRARGFAHWMRPRVGQLGPTQPGSAWLAQHYGWGLDRVFLGRGHSHVVIVEDDMLFSPDFLEYFRATAPLLDADPSLWCISSWNDNGLISFHDWNVTRLFRTSYFPGLGWMMKRDLWLELGPKWPKDHWDHWMRMEDTSRGRECVSPEVNRNKNIGEVGANMNKQAFRRYLATMNWSTEEHVDLGDLSYLLLPGYTNEMRRLLASALPLELKTTRMAPDLTPNATYLVTYKIEEYPRVASKLKLWSYPRGHHQYVASIPFKGARVLVADRRFCPLLPPGQQLKPTPGMRVLASQRNQSCTAACAAQGGLQCNAGDFWFINTCSALKAHFPCERGCTVELGADVPNYVMDPNSPGYRYCLITQKPTRCAAVNPGVARLCPCASPQQQEQQGRLQQEGAGEADWSRERQEQWQQLLGRGRVQSLQIKEALTANRKAGVGRGTMRGSGTDGSVQEGSGSGEGVVQRRLEGSNDTDNE